jgi:hypothetical protein
VIGYLITSTIVDAGTVPGSIPGVTKLFVFEECSNPPLECVFLLTCIGLPALLNFNMVSSKPTWLIKGMKIDAA